MGTSPLRPVVFDLSRGCKGVSRSRSEGATRSAQAACAASSTCNVAASQKLMMLHDEVVEGPRTTIQQNAIQLQRSNIHMCASSARPACNRNRKGFQTFL
jgi:hypothetical protein